MLDTIIIVDSVRWRAQEIQEVVKDQAEHVHVMAFQTDPVDCDRYNFARQVWGVLNEGKTLMVIFNMIALTKTNVVEILKSMERCTGTGSRRIFVSCDGSTTFKRVLKAKKLDPGEFRRVGWDEEGQYLRKIKALFKDQDKTRSA